MSLIVRESFASETLEGVKVNWNMREASWDSPAQPALVALTVGSAEFSDSKKQAVITSEEPTHYKKMILLCSQQYQQNCLPSSKELYFWHPCGLFWPVECYLWVRRKELDLTLNYKAKFVWLTVKEKQSKPSILYGYLPGSGEAMSTEPTDFNSRNTSWFLNAHLRSLKTTTTWDTQNQCLYI